MTVASLPVLAADAARENPEKRPQGALPGPRDPVFPKNEQGHPDWCAAVRQFDHDNAVLMNQIWRADLFRDSRLARKYYNARRNGHLPEREIQLISRFWADAPIDGDKAPRTLWDALDYANYSTVVSACRAAVREAIGAIRDDGETDDGEMHTLQCIAAARGRVRADTDMVELLSTYPNYVGPLFVGYSLGAQKLAEAQVKYREQIIEELCKWPSLLSCWQEPADFPKILGLSLEEIREHQQRHAEEKARCIAELTPFLQ